MINQYIGDFSCSEYNNDFSCSECKEIKLENELNYLNYNKTIYFLCSDCYKEHLKDS